VIVFVVLEDFFFENNLENENFFSVFCFFVSKRILFQQVATKLKIQLIHEHATLLCCR
jgi:hypothetical protein